jgi:hypothetical protein
MAHRNRNEQRTWKARKDPRKLARPTKIHKVKTTDIFRNQDEDLRIEADEAFAEYQEKEER